MASSLRGKEPAGEGEAIKNKIILTYYKVSVKIEAGD